MNFHPCEHFFVSSARDNHVAQCLSIQSGKSEKSSIKCGFVSKKIGRVVVRQLSTGVKAYLINQTWRENVSAKRLAW